MPVCGSYQKGEQTRRKANVQLLAVMEQDMSLDCILTTGASLGVLEKTEYLLKVR